jgi:BRCT domain type II-containing protein
MMMHLVEECTDHDTISKQAMLLPGSNANQQQQQYTMHVCMQKNIRLRPHTTYVDNIPISNLTYNCCMALPARMAAAQSTETQTTSCTTTATASTYQASRTAHLNLLCNVLRNLQFSLRHYSPTLQRIKHHRI